MPTGALLKAVNALRKRGLLPQTPTPWWARMLLDARRREITPIVLYHALSQADGAASRPSHIHSVSQSCLHAQLSLLKQHFTIVPVDEIAARVDLGRSVLGLAAVTFDDGYRSVLDLGLPVLEDLRVPATFYLSGRVVQDGQFWRDKLRFVVSLNATRDFLDFASRLHPVFGRMRPHELYAGTKDPTLIRSKDVDAALDAFLEAKMLVPEYGRHTENAYATEEDLASLDSEVLTIGNHSWHHYVLATQTSTELRQDIEACASLLRRCGQPTSSLFSIPFGGPDSFSPESVRVIRDAGYTGLLLSTAGRPVSAVALQAGIPRFMPASGNQWFLFGNSL